MLSQNTDLHLIRDTLLHSAMVDRLIEQDGRISNLEQKYEEGKSLTDQDINSRRTKRLSFKCQDEVNFMETEIPISFSREECRTEWWLNPYSPGWRATLQLKKRQKISKNINFL